MSNQVMTVLGAVAPEAIGITDAHSHVWIEPVPGGDPGAPQLYDEPNIAQELKEYREPGGSAIIDCQPGGCGRNGNVLRRLSQVSGVYLVACTGFHRRLYYGSESRVWRLTAVQAANHFIDEIRNGLVETRGSEKIVYPGFIKIAAEASFAATRRELLEAAAAACKETGYAIEMHTEKGAAIEDFLQFFATQGVSPNRLVFCHVDKRPDVGLHSEMAAAGVMLEYDTFYRPKYEPEKNVWPLITKMLQGGHGTKLALATDMAESSMWQRLGGQPGLTAFFSQIKNRLERMELEEQAIQKLLGGNIINRLATNLAFNEESS